MSYFASLAAGLRLVVACALLFAGVDRYASRPSRPAHHYSAQDASINECDPPKGAEQKRFQREHSEPASIGNSRDFRAGVAVADITPPREYRMSGYFSERISTGTHDPLYAKAVALSQGREKAILVFCDLVGMPVEISDPVRRIASERTGVPASHILISATHSHTGPLYFSTLRRHFHEQAVAKHGRDPFEEVNYPRQLSERLVEVIARAQRALAPAHLVAAVGKETGLSFNRRFHMKDGTVVFNPGKLNANIVRPAGPIDPDVGVVVFRSAETGKPFASLTVFALHLDTVGGTEYSGDFPHYLEQSLQMKLGKEFVSMFGPGTCGDINHIDVSHNRAQKGHAEAERIGVALAETVSMAIDRAAPQKIPALAVRNTIVDVPLQKYTEPQMQQAIADLHKVGTRELPFLKQVEAVKIVTVQRLQRDTLPMEVQVFRLSDEVAIVGLPGEVFVELGLAIKAASPFPKTLVIELCNDAPAYVPTKKAFFEGSYETVNSRVQPGGGEMLVDAAVRLLRELK